MATSPPPSWLTGQPLSAKVKSLTEANKKYPPSKSTLGSLLEACAIYDRNEWRHIVRNFSPLLIKITDRLGRRYMEPAVFTLACDVLSYSRQYSSMLKSSILWQVRRHHNYDSAVIIITITAGVTIMIIAAIIIITTT